MISMIAIYFFDAWMCIVELRNLITFIYVAEFGSFTKAAKQLGYPQSTISFQIKQLEDELGCLLEVISYLLDAVMIYYGTYFKRGTKRTFEELAALPLDAVFVQTIQRTVTCKEVFELRDLLKALILYVESHTRQENNKAAPSEALTGTYEEMYSNWRNKVEEAAKNNNAFASFMNMCSLQFMLSEIAQDTEIGSFRVMDEYNTNSLADNTEIFDRNLQKYEQVYKQAQISVKRFADVDEFVTSYLS